MTTRHHLGIGTIAVLLATAAFAAPPVDDDLPTPHQLLRELGFEIESWAELRDGGVVSVRPEETSAKELAVSSAIILPVPPLAIAELARSGRLTGLAPDVLQVTVLSGDAVAPGDLDVVRLTPADDDEVGLLLEADFDDVNLADAERGRFAALARDLGTTEPSRAARLAVVELLRETMAARIATYRRGGVAAIAPYRRDDDEVARPADELAAAAAAETVVKRFFPRFHDAFTAPPPAARGEAGVAAEGAVPERRLLAVRRTVADRPAFALVDVTVLEEGPLVLVAERQVYVTHSYNSAQSVYVACAVEGGTLLVCTTRSATDRVTGLRRPVAKRLGRGRLEGAMAAHLKAIRGEVGQ